MIIPYTVPDGQEGSPHPLIRKKKLSPGHHTVVEQRNFHKFIEDIIINSGDYETLDVPHIWIDDDSPGYYIMQQVDTTKPIWLSDRDSCNCYDINLVEDIRIELVRFWKELFLDGYALRGFKLFIQPDNSVMIVGFGKYEVDYYNVEQLPSNFFDDECFPPNFRDYVYPVELQHPN